MNYKSLTEDDVRDILADEPFATVPLWHQGVTLIWAADRKTKRICLWHDVGTGKSLTALYLHDVWESKKLLIVCPNSVVESWEEQIQQHRPDLSAYVLRESMASRLDTISEENTGPVAFICNYDGLHGMFGKRVPIKNSDGSVTKKWVLDRTALDNADIDAIVFDECHYLKSPRAKRTRVCRELSKRAEHVVAMTATPIATGEIDLWGQFDVLDGGSTLTASRGLFLRRWFEKRGGRFGTWEIQDEPARLDMLRRTARCTIRFGRDECLDLPERIYEERRCDLSAEQLSETTNVVEEYVDDPLQIGNKLAQVAGGFIIEGETTRRFKTNPKIDLLTAVLEEVPNEKVIVFHAYVEEGRMIEEQLAKDKIKHIGLRGETANDTWKAFRDDPDCRVLVAHPKSGGEGLNLQCASTVIFFSHGCWGAHVREQCEGRIYRQGQRNRCLFVDLMARGSIDEKRLDTCHSRADLLAKILAYAQDFRVDVRTDRV